MASHLARALQLTLLDYSSSRGIGFELVRQLLASPDNLVVAACRNPATATALHDLKDSTRGVLHVIHMDVSHFDSVRASAKVLEPILGETGLDYLINNAGIVRIHYMRRSELVSSTHHRFSSVSGCPRYCIHPRSRRALTHLPYKRRGARYSLTDMLAVPSEG